ncbi:MAG: DNA topoisomerase IV [Cellvibrio sp.]
MKKNIFQFNACRLGLVGLTVCTLSLGITPFTHASDIKLSGFLSVGGGFVDDENSYPYKGFSEEDLTFENNLFGLQVTGTVAENLTVTAQAIARTRNNYSLNSEWAYLTWQASDTTRVRVGRLRSPFYLFSDSLDVGYSYAWISPPEESYGIPFNNVDGVDVYTTATLGSFDTSFQAYFGGFSDEVDFNGLMTSIKTRNQMGVVATLGKDWWTLRGGYHTTDVWVDVNQVPLSETMTIGGFAQTLTAFGFAKNGNNLLVEDDNTAFTDVGLTIDTGTFVAALEHTEMEVKDSFIAKRVREYVMGGVRISDWLIHLTFSRSDDESARPEAGIPAGVALPMVGSTNVLIGTLQAIAGAQVETRDVITLGTRWDVTSGTAIKFQIDDIDDETKGDQKLFSVAVQTVF